MGFIWALIVGGVIGAIAGACFPVLVQRYRLNRTIHTVFCMPRAGLQDIFHCFS